MSQVSTSLTTAATLEATLRQRGFTLGAPAHIDPVTRLIDAEAARLMICPVCHKPGMRARAFRKGREYVVLACCPVPRCGGCEEM